MATEGIKTEEEYPKETKRLFVSTKLIRPNRLNPRTEVDKEEDKQLLQSISVRGVDTEIRVRPIEEDEEGHLYEVYDGDRRLRAAIKAKQATVPILILSKTDDEVLEFGLSLHRPDNLSRRRFGVAHLRRTLKRRRSGHSAWMPL